MREARADTGSGAENRLLVADAVVVFFPAHEDGAAVGIETKVGYETQVGVETKVGIETQVGVEPKVGIETQVGVEPKVGIETQVGGDPKVGIETQVGVETKAAAAMSLTRLATQVATLILILGATELLRSPSPPPGMSHGWLYSISYGASATAVFVSGLALGILFFRPFSRFRHFRTLVLVLEIIAVCSITVAVVCSLFFIWAQEPIPYAIASIFFNLGLLAVLVAPIISKDNGNHCRQTTTATGSGAKTV